MRVGKRVQARNLRSFYAYYRFLDQAGEERKTEILLLLDLLTINEIGFFRNRPQFRLFENVVIPECRAASRSPAGRSPAGLRRCDERLAGRVLRRATTYSQRGRFSLQAAR